MSVAEATPDLEQVDRHDRAFLGHPRGLRAFALFILALTLLPTVILAVVFLVLALTLP